MAAQPRPASPSRTRVPAGAGAAGAAGGEVREIEWQLTAPDLGVVRRWLEQHGLLDELSIVALPPQQIHDTYLDTDDWRVMRAGFALRVREKKGAQAEATLKGLRSARDDAADRREITEPLSGSKEKGLARAAGPVGTRVRAVAGVKPLRTLFEVRTWRQRFAVRRRDTAADVGEIALDEARFSRGNGHRRPMLLTRVELEAVGSDSGPVERLAARLCVECGLHRATENKFAVGLRSASLEPPRDARPGARAEPPAAVMDAATRAVDFAARALLGLLREWQANEPAARLGEGPEALHKLRVTGRRMDTVLGLFRGCLPGSLSRARPMVKSLVDTLGGVRDVDIRLQAVSAYRNSLPEGDRQSLDPLLRHLESERTRARAAMLRALDTKPTQHWLDTLPDQLARAVTATPAASPGNAPVLTVVPGLIRKRYRKLRKCARRLTPGSSIAEFHKVRIRTKKLRYALEVVGPTYAKRADDMLGTLHKLQSRLGTQHDADVVARYLAALATHPPADFTTATLFMMGRMAELNAAQAARMGRKIGKPWRKVRRRRWRALRSRMRRLSKEARDYNRKVRAARQIAGRNLKATGTGFSGRLGGSSGNGRLPIAPGTWTPSRASRH